MCSISVDWLVVVMECWYKGFRCYGWALFNCDLFLAYGDEAQFRSFKKRKVAADQAFNLKKYEEQKEKMGHKFYSGTLNADYGTNSDLDDSKVDMLIDNVRQQEARRAQFSRRRTFDDDDQIGYINERNKKFGEKMDRYYSKYTQDIKEKLERGTA